MSWISLALVLLKVVNNIMTWVRERELISTGYDKAISEVTQSILVKTVEGQAIMEKINAMSDEDVDTDLRNLEPK